MNILGISAFYHDSAAAILQNGKIVAAAHEERFTRKKHDPSFPSHAIEFCLKYSGLDIDGLDAVAFYDKPLLKFERLLESYYAVSPKGLASFIKSMPVWLDEKMFLKRVIYKGLRGVQEYDKSKLKLLFPEHHLSHAASAFYPSPFENAAILTIDGVGEWATTSISLAEGNKITILKELHFPHSLGLLYSSFTYFLGFKVNSGEYKMMGLAPYGIAHDPETQFFISQIKEHLIKTFEDGSIWLNPKYFQYISGLKMIYERKWEKLFQIKCRKSESELLQSHCNLALAIQLVTEDIVMSMAREAKRLTDQNNLCMAGGVALNSVANGKLAASNIFENIFIQPAAGDAGGALGAAAAANYIYFQQARKIDSQQDQMQGAYLGPKFSDHDIELISKKFKADYKYFKDSKELLATVATCLANGKVVGWFQGRMEYGPRALGARSILGDARNPEMQKKLNLKIKNRESFRPFAPSVHAEDAEHYFEMHQISPYMLYVFPVKAELRAELTEEYAKLPMNEKLYTNRSKLPGITHVDFSARIQTVHRHTNPKFWDLIQAFKELTGYSVLINTSFNVRGEPIVCSPKDAFNCFMQTDMDILVMNNFFFEKEKQSYNVQIKKERIFSLD